METSSIASHHLLSVIHSETPMERKTISILEVGCGDGRLMAFLHQMLASYRPGVELSIHGFDVSDSNVQQPGFLDEAHGILKREVPEVDWSQRIHMLTSTSTWPYEPGTFDWVVSNYVLEHVADHQFVLGEVRRVLKDGGKSVHLFPVRESLVEQHVFMPFVHWIRDHDRLRGTLKAMSLLGIGNYRRQRREDPTLDLDRFAETRADYLTYFVNYPSKSELLRMAKHAGLRASFRYTEHYYLNKARQFLRLDPLHRIRPFRFPIVRALLVFVLSRLVGVTYLLEKKQIYTRDSHSTSDSIRAEH